MVSGSAGPSASPDVARVLKAVGLVFRWKSSLESRGKAARSSARVGEADQSKPLHGQDPRDSRRLEARDSVVAIGRTKTPRRGHERRSARHAPGLEEAGKANGRGRGLWRILPRDIRTD